MLTFGAIMIITTVENIKNIHVISWRVNVSLLTLSSLLVIISSDHWPAINTEMQLHMQAHTQDEVDKSLFLVVTMISGSAASEQARNHLAHRNSCCHDGQLVIMTSQPLYESYFDLQTSAQQQ